MAEVIPRFQVTVNGDRNPVRVAYAWLKAACSDDMIDHESFEELARVVGDIDKYGPMGFIVNGIDDLEHLCRLGKFEIVIGEHGKVSASRPLTRTM